MASVPDLCILFTHSGMLRTMTGDKLKDDVNNTTSFCNRSDQEFDVVLHTCGFMQRKSALYRVLGL